MAEPSDNEQGTTSDPNDPGAAVDRYRDLAKWIITSFAAVGALLVAGTQLASLGKLTFDDDLWRLIAAGVSLGVALVGTILVIGKALGVLKPVEMSFEKLRAEPEIRGEIEAQPELLPFDARSLDEVKMIFDRKIASPTRPESAKEKFRAQVEKLLDYAAYLRVENRFDDAWRTIKWLGLGVAASLAVFAWAANPPDDTDEASAAVPPTPTPITVTLNSNGQGTLKGELGDQCVTGPFPAIAIGGDEDTPTVISQPSATCELARFSLPTDLGSYESADTAPESK